MNSLFFLFLLGDKVFLKKRMNCCSTSYWVKAKRQRRILTWFSMEVVMSPSPCEKSRILPMCLGCIDWFCCYFCCFCKFVLGQTKRRRCRWKPLLSFFCFCTLFLLLRAWRVSNKLNHLLLFMFGVEVSRATSSSSTCISHSASSFLCSPGQAWAR